MSEREYDVIVWGATGFTGQLVVEYLAQNYGVGGDINWAIGGRNRDKLEQVRATYLPADQRDSLQLVTADSEDRAAMEALARRTRVVCTTVGPYARHGTPLVAACAHAGTDYCDLTGEVPWMARVIPEYESAARDSGARLVHTCGFDSVPFDMGTWFLQQTMHARHGVYARQVKGRVAHTRGGASGGTIASMLNIMEEAKKDPQVRRLMADPYVLYPADEEPGPDGPDQKTAVYDPDFDQWTSPFIMAGINTRVVRRSNALLGFPWGRDFRYDEAILNRSRAQAVSQTLAIGGGMLAMALGPTRALARRFLPKPGEGPDRAQREAGSYEILFLGIDPEDRGRDTRVRVRGDRDPGYGSTSRMLGEAAVCLARDEPVVEGGFWTPASALGQSYLERLQDNAGLQFDVIEDT
ncbi:MAG: saccharopine dehydrogenase NADP-binding domain-containing protein [Halioglobus sp.]|nr:saccharopine dehydrogenase NADP-binding domain-containing protein [Halioglobus sp.]